MEDLPPESTTGNITFVITEENTPQTLDGVYVQIVSDDDASVVYSNRSDDIGRCTFSNMPIGSYKLNLSKPGYEAKSDLPIRINGGNNPNRELSLKRVTTLLSVEPSMLDFGQSASVVQKAFSIVNPNYHNLDWTVLAPGVPWIVSICDKDGKSTGTLSYNSEVAMYLTINRDHLAGGNNEAVVVILSDFGRAELKVKAIGQERNLAVTNVNEVQDIQMTSASFSAEILSVGVPEYTERGFVYKTSTIKSVDESGCVVVTAPMNSEKIYSVTVPELSKGTKYYVRAYAKNPVGISLSSNEVSFSTISVQTDVETMQESFLDVVKGQVQLNGNIKITGNPVYSEKGFCVNTVGTPVISDTKYVVSGTNSGNFSYSCAGLSTMTTYYVRAYAIQNGKVIYGNTINFNTNLSPTIVETSSATNVTSSSARLNASILHVGTPEFTEKGFCYSLTSSNPTIADTKVTVSGTTVGDYSYLMQGLDYNTTYRIRAYAIQSGEPIYGERVSFTTLYTAPEVNTLSPSDVGYTSMTLNGYVLTKGDPAITERGFCYGTSSYVSISDNIVKVSGVLGDYKVKIENLEEGTKYYVRAYVIQGGKAIYGQYVQATTWVEPLVQTGPVINLKLSSNGFNYQATFQGAFDESLSGTPNVTSIGFVYGEQDNPTVDNATVVNYDSYNYVANSDAIVYNKTVSNLWAGKTYYVRAYVRTSVGCSYGETQRFTVI